jgi:hypothetical protein
MGLLDSTFKRISLFALYLFFIICLTFIDSLFLIVFVFYSFSCSNLSHSGHQDGTEFDNFFGKKNKMKSEMDSLKKVNFVASVFLSLG